MLYYTYEIISRPYILEWNSISLIFFFSPSLILLFYPHLCLYFTSQVKIRLIFLLFLQKRFQLLQWFERYVISWLVLLIDPIYRNRLVNMLVNRILKHGKKSLAYQIFYRAAKKIQQKTEKNPLSVLRQAIRRVTPDIAVKARRVSGSITITIIYKTWHKTWHGSKRQFILQ